MQDYIHELLFTIKIHQASGESFQKLFSDIVKYHIPNFQKIAPHGNWGDGGNDGWIPETRHFYQVYAPKSSTKPKITDIISKAKEDFEKIEKKWGEINHYTFVFNDHFEGIPAPLSLGIDNLKKEKSLETVNILSSDDLLVYFKKMDSSSKNSIVGTFIDKPDYLDNTAIGELLSHLIEKSESNFSFLSEEAPDLNKKISINNISERIAIRIQSKSYETYIIDEYLKNLELESRQSISIYINEIYEKGKKIFSKKNQYQDLLYFWMLDELIPKEIKQFNNYKLSNYRNSCEIILAKYFETCDVYEHPNNNSTT